MEPVAIFVAHIFGLAVTDRLGAVAPGGQLGTNLIFIHRHIRAGNDGLHDQGFNCSLFDIRHHLDDAPSPTFDHSKDRRLFLFKGVASTDLK